MMAFVRVKRAPQGALVLILNLERGRRETLGTECAIDNPNDAPVVGLRVHRAQALLPLFGRNNRRVSNVTAHSVIKMVSVSEHATMQSFQPTAFYASADITE